MNQQRKSSKILLLGDSCYDYYHYGSVSRISPEAPIPIFDHKFQVVKHGMASNVYENLKSLGVETDIITEFLENKKRYIDLKSKQQVIRVDERLCWSQLLIDSLPDLDQYDAVVISDYNKGFLSYEVLSYISKNFSGPIYADTKKNDLKQFRNVIFKINEHERKNLITIPDNMIVTRGGENVVWHRPKPDADMLFFPPKVNVHDVCGAGDTFLAALVVEHLHTEDMESAIRFAIKAASITVQNLGVYAPTIQEIDNDN